MLKPRCQTTRLRGRSSRSSRRSWEPNSNRGEAPSHSGIPEAPGHNSTRLKHLVHHNLRHLNNPSPRFLGSSVRGAEDTWKRQWRCRAKLGCSDMPLPQTTVAKGLLPKDYLCDLYTHYEVGPHDFDVDLGVWLTRWFLSQTKLAWSTSSGSFPFLVCTLSSLSWLCERRRHQVHAQLYTILWERERNSERDYFDADAEQQKSNQLSMHSNLFAQPMFTQFLK